MEQECQDQISRYALSEAPGHLIRRCQQRAVDLFAEEVGDDGPTPRQFAVLLTVFQRPGISQTDLVRLTGIDRSTLTGVLRRLIDRGLIDCSREPRDLRTNSLRLTSGGRTALFLAFEAAERAQDRILEPIEPEHRETVIAILNRLAGPS